MKKYIMLALSRLQLDIAYPAWYWSHLFVTLSKLVLLVSFWQAIFANRADVGGWQLHALITYSIISVMLNEYVHGASWELGHLIRSGQVAVELLRPYDLLGRLAAQDAGTTLSNLLKSAVPITIFMAFVYHLDPPAGWVEGCVFIGSAILGMIAGSLIDLIIGTMAFWLENMWGLRVFKSAIFLFFNGTLVPLNLFPEWLQELCRWTPFPSLVYTPVAIYTGRISGFEIWTAVGMQLFWIVIIYLTLRSVWLVALRKVTVFGG